VVPLDATSEVLLDQEHVEHVEHFEIEATLPAAETVAQLWGSHTASLGAAYATDIVAAVTLAMPDSAQWEWRSLAIVTDKPNDLGQTLLQPEQPPNVKVCLGVDIPRLLDELIGVLNQVSPHFRSHHKPSGLSDWRRPILTYPHNRATIVAHRFTICSGPDWAERWLCT
jgi:inosine-uridine nucleoside N-ribohydrolase